jgi:N-acetylmuramoyl-L-alanine amidase
MKKSRKRVITYGLLAVNAVLLFAVMSFVLKSPSTGSAVKQSSLAGNVEAANPLDQLSSSDIAVHLARMSNLPEATAVVNQADTISGQQSVSSADNKVVSKPQIINTAAKSYRDIQIYIAKPGDTLASLATKFGVTSDSIRWSNNLESNAIPVGRQLFIPPVNGFVHLVQAGDTVGKLAEKYNASKASIAAFNDAEIGGLVVGRRIVIPDGTKQTSAYNVSYYGGGSGGGGGFAWGSSAAYGANGYDYGWCTWYVASRVSVPNNWGNANTWNWGASASGWTVSKAPRAGSIGQTTGPGWGHVAYVEAVREGPGGYEIKYSDMNGLAGWGRVGYSDWVSASKFDNYIYR